MATTYNASGMSLNAITAERAGDVIAVHSTYELTAALVVNDVVKFATLPANCVPVDCVLDCDDLDTGVAPAVVVEVGFTGGDTDALVAASTVGQAGGVERANVKTAFRVEPTGSDRVVQLKVATAPATGAAAGTIGLTLTYRAAQVNE